MKRLFLIPLLLGLLLAAAPVCALETGQPAPDFKLTTLDGKAVSLSDFKGQPILLKLATTWCPTCKQQTDEILDAAEFLKENQVAVVEVFLQDSEEMVKEYFEGKTFEMDHAVLIDDGQAYKAYNVYLIPRVLLIDRDFIIRRDGSLMRDDDLIEGIEKMPKG